MPEFKFGDEVEFTFNDSGHVYIYVGPHGDTGEHIMYNLSDGRAYKTYNPDNYRHRPPRKGELWAQEILTAAAQRVLVVHADEHFVVYTNNWERKRGVPEPVGNLFTASRTGDFTRARKVVERNE